MNHQLNNEISDEIFSRLALYLYDRHPEFHRTDLTSKTEIEKMTLESGIHEEMLKIYFGLNIYCSSVNMKMSDLDSMPIGEFYQILDKILGSENLNEKTKIDVYRPLLDPRVQIDEIHLSKKLSILYFIIPNDIKNAVFKDANGQFPRDSKLKIEWAPSKYVSLEKQTDLKAYSDHDAFIEGLTFKEITDIPQEILRILVSKGISEVFSVYAANLSLD